MKLIVSDFSRASDKFAACTHAVSFQTEKGYPALNIPDANWLKLIMEDLYSNSSTREYRHAETIVAKLLAFAKTLPEDALVGFNCWAGISRSTAAALIVAVAVHGFDEGTAVYDEAVHMAAPNKTLIRIADVALDLNRTLLDWVEHSVERYYTKSGVIIPKGLLRLANKSEKDLISDADFEAALAKEFGIDVDKES